MKGHKHPTALLQMATRSHVHAEQCFVVDMLRIGKELMIQMGTVLENALMNKDVIKLGQGLTGDLQELCDSYPEVSAFQAARGILDTNAMLKALHPDVPHAASLKSMVKTYLHCNLVKTQQMTNWAKRPLTDKQLHYAACDALVLLRLYDAMRFEIDEIGGRYVTVFSHRGVLSVIDASTSLRCNYSYFGSRN